MMKPLNSLQTHIHEFALTLPEKSKVLDVGCGQRPYEKFFSHGQYLGIEVEVSGGQSFEKIPDQYFDGIHIPFPDEHFDAMICTQVLEHCVEPETLLDEMRRVLKPEGKVFISVPFIWGEHQTPFDFRRFTSFGLKKIITERGLQLLSYHRVQPGIDAIVQLVESEMQHFEKNTQPADFFTYLKRKFSKKLWGLTLRFWRRTYQFERVYLDNVLIAKK